MSDVMVSHASPTYTELDAPEAHATTSQWAAASPSNGWPAQRSKIFDTNELFPNHVYYEPSRNNTFVRLSINDGGYRRHSKLR
jgi:hypothetical protein